MELLKHCLAAGCCYVVAYFFHIVWATVREEKRIRRYNKKFPQAYKDN